MASDSANFLRNPADPNKPFVCVSFPEVTKLQPTNYLNWKNQIEALLDGYDLLQFVDGTYPVPPETITTTATPPVTKPNPEFTYWRRQDRLLCGAILTTLTESVASLVSAAKSSTDLWTKLKNAYAKPSRGHIKQLQARLRSASKGALSIQDYLHSVKVTADLLASLGHPVSEEDFTDHVLRGLDAAYRPVIEGINARDSSLSFEDLLEKLRMQEFAIASAQTHSPSPVTALTAQTRPNRSDYRSQKNAPSGGSKNSGPKPFLGKCQYCDIRGHVLSHCAQFRKDFPQAKTPQRAHQAQVNSAVSGPSPPEFLVDSGATDHVTQDLNNLAVYHPYSGPDSLFMGNGSGSSDGPTPI